MATAYYDRYWTTEGFQPTGNTFKELGNFLADHAKAGQSWLDVGCGDGRTSGVWLASNGIEYTGVDVSQTAVAEACSIGLDARLIEDAGSLPFDDDTFDGIVMVEVLEHLFEPQVAAREILRVLKPGGTFFATVPNVAYWRRRLELGLLGRFDPIGDDLSIDQPWRDPHIRFFTAATLHHMLAGEGFAAIKVAGHAGAWVSDWPRVGRGRTGNSAAYRWLEARAPGLLGKRLNVVARKAD
ncbi:MAG: class I SAM-dependent methyltransferase [Baekduia sp.]